LDWIISHVDSLARLVLDDCPIISVIKNHNGDPPLKEYPRTWSEFFSRCEISLRNLKGFKFGKGKWESRDHFDGAEWEVVGLHERRYMGFHGGMGPSPWLDITKALDYIGDEALKSRGDAHLETAGKTDAVAYHKLMAVVNSRFSLE
jgi:hypothetical protein